MKTTRKRLAAALTFVALLIGLLSVAAPAQAAKAVATAKVTLDRTGTIHMNVGEKLTVKAAVTPGNSTQKLTGVSSRKKVATVSAGKVTEKTDESGRVTARVYEGVIKAKAEGTAVITVRSGRKSASVKVKVVDPKKPTGVKLDLSGTVKVELGDSLTLLPTLKPATAVSALHWTSSGKKIAKVTGKTVDGVQLGVVKALKEGTATVTVRTANGKTASVKIRVIDSFKPKGVALDRTGTVKVNLGETLDLAAALQPETARSALTWSTSNKKVARVAGKAVDQAHGTAVVKAVKAGTATITVRTRNGKKATVKVQVVDPKKAAGVRLDQTGTVPLPLNRKLNLAATVSPETAAPTTALTWTSGDKKVATVSARGVVTPKKKGTATITVRTDTGKTASVKVKVVDAVPLPTAIVGEWAEGGCQAAPGEVFRAAVRLEPGGIDTAVAWSSSDEAIARVRSSEGSEGRAEAVIEPVSPGVAVIIARTENGLSASFALRVTEPPAPPAPEETTPAGTETDANGETPGAAETDAPGETPEAAESDVPGETPGATEIDTPMETPAGTEPDAPEEAPEAAETEAAGETPETTETEVPGEAESEEPEANEPTPEPEAEPAQRVDPAPECRLEPVPPADAEPASAPERTGGAEEGAEARIAEEQA